MSHMKYPLQSRFAVPIAIEDNKKFSNICVHTQMLIYIHIFNCSLHTDVQYLNILLVT